MRQELIQTLLPSKIQKLKHILDWATEHCNEEQFDRVNETINDYREALLYYPFHGTANIAHETDYIATNIPDQRDLVGTQQEQEQLKKELDKHKEIVNELQARIHELEELTDQP